MRAACRFNAGHMSVASSCGQTVEMYFIDADFDAWLRVGLLNNATECSLIPTNIQETK
jgi:hypothetical protein